MPANEPPADGPRWESRGSGPAPSGQWTSPAPPPQKRPRSRACLWGCGGALAAVIVIVVVVVVIAQGGSDESTTPAPGRTTTDTTPREKTQEPRGERADLTTFQLDDRSEAGITNIWVAWTIKNSSSEQSDYSWDWEAVDAGGTRLTNGSQLETDVQPGQTARGEYPTTLKSVKGVKLNITNFNRTVSY